MRCWTNVERAWRGLLMVALLSVAVGLRAANSDLPHMHVYQQGVTLMLDAQVPLQMPAETEAVLRKGVPLAVVQEVKVVQSRWYWQDAVLTSVRREWTLSYQALTQRWRVMLRNGEQVEQFDDAASAWAFLTTVKQWPIGNVPQLGALQDAEAVLTWSVGRRVADSGAALSMGDAGAAWRLSTTGRVPIPTTLAPVRDAMSPRPGGG